MPQHSQGTNRQRRGAGAAVCSDLSDDRKTFCKGQRGEVIADAMHKSSELN